MGGSGSGREYDYAKHALVPSARCDIRAEARKWPLKPGEQIDLPVGDASEGEHVSVTLSFTPCHFGGSRPWFDCPSCGGRVAILYRWRRWWRCRKCLGLKYRSSQEGQLERAIRKVSKLRHRLDGSDTIFDPWPRKPPRMHWSTYWRLTAALRAATNKAMILTAV